MLFPFTMGMFLMRNFREIPVRGAFWICSLVLLLLFIVPFVEGNEPVLWNGAYEMFCVILVFPVLILLGASGKTTDKRSTMICKFPRTQERQPPHARLRGAHNPQKRYAPRTQA